MGAGVPVKTGGGIGCQLFGKGHAAREIRDCLGVRPGGQVGGDLHPVSLPSDTLDGHAKQITT